MFDSGVLVSDLISDLKAEVDVAPVIEDKSYIGWLNSLQQLVYSEIVKEQGKIEVDNIENKAISLDELTVPQGEDKIRYEDIHAVYADGTQLIESTLASGVIFPDTYYRVDNKLGVNINKNFKKTIKRYVGDSVPTGKSVKLVCVHTPTGGDNTTVGGSSVINIDTFTSILIGSEMTNCEEWYGVDLTGQTITEIADFVTLETCVEHNEDWYAVFEAIGHKNIKVIYFVRPELIDEKNYTAKKVMVPVEFIDLVKAKLRGEAYKLMNEDAFAAKWLNDYNVLLEDFRAWVEDKRPQFGL